MYFNRHPDHQPHLAQHHHCPEKLNKTNILQLYTYMYIIYFYIQKHCNQLITV